MEETPIEILPIQFEPESNDLSSTTWVQQLEFDKPESGLLSSAFLILIPHPKAALKSIDLLSDPPRFKSSSSNSSSSRTAFHLPFRICIPSCRAQILAKRQAEIENISQTSKANPATFPPSFQVGIVPEAKPCQSGH